MKNPTTHHHAGEHRVWSVADPDAAGATIGEMYDDLAAMQHELWLCVGALHYGGMTWSRIAEVTGLNSKQAAMKRYKGAREVFARFLADVSSPDEWEREQAQAELAAIERRLSIRPVRITWEVRQPAGDTPGELVSTHYVSGRAFSAAGEQLHVWQLDPRSGKRRRFRLVDGQLVPGRFARRSGSPAAG